MLYFSSFLPHEMKLKSEDLFRREKKLCRYFSSNIFDTSNPNKNMMPVANGQWPSWHTIVTLLWRSHVRISPSPNCDVMQSKKEKKEKERE